jgi:hypothetical protein
MGKMHGVSGFTSFIGMHGSGLCLLMLILLPPKEDVGPHTVPSR